MSGVYIKGMEIPDKCGHCRFADAFDCWVDRQFIPTHDARRKDCPLIEIPPHGRLGDLDELYNHLNEWYLTHEHGFSETEKIYIMAMLSGVKDSPTIIPASEEG